MIAPKLACPSCRKTVPEVFWREVDLVRCPSCESRFEQVRFPALMAARRVDRASALAAGEANCYFHAANRAEVACDGCGRYICAVCRVPLAGQSFCPACLEVRTERRKLPENHRVLYGNTALMLTILPLLFWPITLLTAPAALGLCIYGWKKPGSIVRKRWRWRLIIAGVLAVIEIGGWVLLFGSILLH